MSQQLPIELWALIAKSNPCAYNILVRAIKAIRKHVPSSTDMEDACRGHTSVSLLEYNTELKLPAISGMVHTYPVKHIIPIGRCAHSFIASCDKLTTVNGGSSYKYGDDLMTMKIYAKQGRLWRRVGPVIIIEFSRAATIERIEFYADKFNGNLERVVFTGVSNSPVHMTELDFTMKVARSVGIYRKYLVARLSANGIYSYSDSASIHVRHLDQRAIPTPVVDSIRDIASSFAQDTKAAIMQARRFALDMLELGLRVS